MELRDRLIWIAVAALGAVSFGIVALSRGEVVNAAWLVIAAVCVYAIAYRFYALFIVRTALGVDFEPGHAGLSAEFVIDITARFLKANARRWTGDTEPSCSARPRRREARGQPLAPTAVLEGHGHASGEHGQPRVPIPVQHLLLACIWGPRMTLDLPPAVPRSL